MARPCCVTGSKLSIQFERGACCQLRPKQARLRATRRMARLAAWPGLLSATCPMRRRPSGRKLGRMTLDGYAVLTLIVGLIVLLDLAAMRWGVDSRLADVRNDLV